MDIRTTPLVTYEAENSLGAWSSRKPMPAEGFSAVIAEPVNVEPPAHPMHALTTYELRDYRGQLEHALKRLPEHAEVRTLIRQRLDEVLKEQEERIRLATGSAR